jgi:P4 family phage/plasmid primase-like protien
MYYDKDFYNNLDENRDLLGFKNGVLDLRNEIFREGKPEDYLSNSTNVNYIEYDPNNPKIKEVQKFFREVQPDEDVRNYVLDLFCSCLQGHTPDEKFHIWTGSGGNGKSQCVSLFQKSMGDYATTLPITLLTGKRPSATAANPELAKCKGVRFAVFQEPENDDKIHVGHMKEITGNDKISARGLYKEPVEFYPQFKTLLTCNKLPRIPSSDGGTWRRLRVVPFEMVFCENPKAPNERKMDKRLKEKLDGWTEPFLSILFNERFKIYKKNDFKIKEPFKVTECTTAYQKRSDLILEFSNEHLEKTENKKDKLNFSVVWNEFKAWFREAHTEIRIPSRTEFRDDFSEKFGKINKNCWSGIIFKIDNNNNNNNNEDAFDSDSDSDDSNTLIGNKKMELNTTKKTILRAL